MKRTITNRLTIACRNCGILSSVKPSFTDRKFCHKKCYLEYFSVRKRVAFLTKKKRVNYHKKKVACEGCGKLRQKQHQHNPYCNKCRDRHGKSNPNWRGGTKSLGAKIRDSRRYAYWRKSVFFRDKYHCVSCGAGGYLHADHIKPFAYFPELRFSLTNGRTLCVECHKKTDTYLSGVFKYRNERNRTIESYS